MHSIARITVKETHGIRRFLYPLSARIRIPETHRDAELTLLRDGGQTVPLQLTPADPAGEGLFRLDFAVSMAPFETVDLFLCGGKSDLSCDDPLKIHEGERIRIEQRRFTIEFDRLGGIHAVFYDNLRHLRAPGSLTRNGEKAVLLSSTAHAAGLPLAARCISHSRYTGGCNAHTGMEVSAWKSWIMLRHRLEKPGDGDEVAFSLPLAARSKVLTCDFGVAGGIYGKLQEDEAADIAWRTDFSDDGSAQWSLSSAGRADYCGRTAKREDYLPQCWFHVIDGGKALATAITTIPDSCRTMTVSLNARGNADIAFQLAGTAAAPVEFGICYHFLNDVPALSAATNPQSILQPPTVQTEIGGQAA